MNRLLIASIDRFGPLHEDARESLTKCSQTTRHVAPGEPILLKGDTCRLRLLSSGMAVRQQVLTDGARQILGIVIPGDLLDLSGLFSGADHEVSALGSREVRATTGREVRGLIRQHPNLLAALCRAVLTEARVQRNWIVSLGRRSALSRAANLLCEVYARQKMVGLVGDGRCRFPALQADIADALGLSIVHTHRLLRSLAASGLATLHGGYLKIGDWDRLSELAGSDAEPIRAQHDTELARRRRPTTRPAEFLPTA